ncbi:hypothetical protein N0V95_000531 [Ascochyta clinopodiicola]|nr:hypothetical protein N0V95_000531 [Ascochyta clinopodiicola]
MSAWLYIELTNETELANEDLVITNITIGERPHDPVPDTVLEELSGKIWLSKKEFRKQMDQAVTGVDILYGEDAVDPRPQWNLLQPPLHLDACAKIPVARLSIQRGKAEPKPDARKALRVPENGIFKILQISDLHMTTGVGVCNDAMDSDGKPLSARTADPLTVDFMGKMLDRVEPNMVVVTGDQVHHDIDDSQTALFKAVAPMEARRIPYATVFGNHDSEGAHAQSREFFLNLTPARYLTTRIYIQNKL